MDADITDDRTDDLIARLDREAEEAIARAALDVEAGAKQRAPVDTGHLRGSIQARRVGVLSWIVSVGASYGVYIELGTRRKAARPFLLPALRSVRSRLLRELREIFR